MEKGKGIMYDEKKEAEDFSTSDIHSDDEQQDEEVEESDAKSSDQSASVTSLTTKISGAESGPGKMVLRSNPKKSQKCWIVLRSNSKSHSDEATGEYDDSNNWVFVDTSNLPSRLDILLEELTRDFFKVMDVVKESKGDAIILVSGIFETLSGLHDLRDEFETLKRDPSFEALAQMSSVADVVIAGIEDMINGGVSTMPVVWMLLKFMLKSANKIRQTLSYAAAARYGRWFARSPTNIQPDAADENGNSSTDLRSADAGYESDRNRRLIGSSSTSSKGGNGALKELQK